MNTRLAYCSACDRDVRVVFPEGTDFVDGQANIPDPEIICLEIGHRCTGAMCPVAAQPPAVMAVRLIRSGLDAAVPVLVTGRCTSCDQLSKFALIDLRYATCTTCGVTTEYATLDTPTKAN